MAAVESPAAAVETPSGFESLWDLVDVIQCITLRTRPERQRQAAAQFERVGIAHRVHFLVQEPDVQDGKRGCFHAHQQAARRALELGARRALTFEDDVEFTADFTPFAAARAAKFVGGAEPWEIFFLGHFPRKMELTAQRDVVKVRSMDGHAYLLSPEGMRRLCSLEYRGDQARPIRTGWCQWRLGLGAARAPRQPSGHARTVVSGQRRLGGAARVRVQLARPTSLARTPQVDVHYHYECAQAYALYPMVALQRASYSDTEALERPDDWNQDKLAREEQLYRGAVGRQVLGGLLPS